MSEFNEELTATIVRRRRSTTGWLTEQEFWAALSTSAPCTECNRLEGEPCQHTKEKR